MIFVDTMQTGQRQTLMYKSERINKTCRCIHLKFIHLFADMSETAFFIYKNEVLIPPLISAL